MRKINWNTLIITVGLSVGAFFSKEVYNEIRATHDAVLLLRAQMVSRPEFDAAIAEWKSRSQATDVQIQELKVEIQKLKRTNP